MAAKRKAGRKKKQQQTPGWVWLLTGLFIGLAIAAGIYVKDRGGTAALVEKAKQAVPAKPAKPDASTAEPEDDGPTFDFYNMLPDIDFEVPDEEFGSKPPARPKTIEKPGTYVLQVGSFSTAEDADRMRASLALMNIVAKIQRVSVNDKVYHRVLIGPITDNKVLNRTRSQLIDANINPMTITLSD